MWCTVNYELHSSEKRKEIENEEKHIDGLQKKLKLM